MAPIDVNLKKILNFLIIQTTIVQTVCSKMRVTGKLIMPVDSTGKITPDPWVRQFFPLPSLLYSINKKLHGMTPVSAHG